MQVALLSAMGRNTTSGLILTQEPQVMSHGMTATKYQQVRLTKSWKVFSGSDTRGLSPFKDEVLYDRNYKGLFFRDISLLKNI